MNQTHILKLLCARLGLPLPTVRWWTYWNIASLLDDPDTAESTYVELLTRLSLVQLESEAVELLTPLLLAKRPIRNSFAEVRSAIGRPSVLSDHNIAHIYGEPIAVPSWLSAHSGHAPVGFAVTDKDRDLWSHRIKIGVLPMLAKLSERTDMDLVRQFEYEMLMLASKYPIHKGQLDCFAGGYQRNELTGALDEQEDHLWRSAYLRTAAYAVTQGAMAPDTAVAFCHNIMPLSRWIGKMSPPACVPTWVPRPEFRAEAPEKFANGFVSSLAKFVADESRDSEVLGVLDARVVSTSLVEVEMLAILVLTNPKEATDIEKFFSNPTAYASPDEGSAEEFSLVNPYSQQSRDPEFSALAEKLSVGLDGYLQTEILMRPPWVPIPMNAEERIVCRTGERPELLFFLGEREIGRCLYWNYEWSPVYDKRVGPSACTATLFSKEYVKSLSFSRETTGNILWCAKVLSRDDDHLDFSEKKLLGSLSVSL